MKRTAVVIGCGKAREGKEGWAIGHAHAYGWRAADPEIRLLGVDVSAENLQAFGEAFQLPQENLFSSTKALYAEIVPDFASICTWPSLHAAQVIEAAERGVRGIACEKPAALDPGLVREMVEKCEAAKACLAIAHQRRHQPGFRLLKKLLHQGRIGRPWVLEARVPDGWDILSWTTHWFDLANFVFDHQPLSVLAGLHHTGQRRYGQAVEDESLVRAAYPDGHEAIFITGPEKPLAPWITVRGSDGLITSGADGDFPLDVFSREGFTSHQPEAMGYLDAFSVMLAELIGAVEQGMPMACAAAHTAAATEMAYAAQESARAMRRISFPVDFHYAPLEVVQHPSRANHFLPEVVLYADEHFGSGGADGLGEALREICGGNITRIDAATDGLRVEILNAASLLVLYHTQAEPCGETHTALRAWVTTGRPLLLVHAALGAYPKWEEYQAWCGRTWVWGQSEHPYEETRLAGLADWPWQDAWLPRDEVFTKLGVSSPTIDLVMAENHECAHPAAWLSKEFPSIGVWVPGHRNDLWLVPAMREGLGEIIRRITLP